MLLKPFTEKSYSLLSRWINTDELNYLWGGPRFDFPLTIEQISQHCSAPEVNPFIVVLDGNEVGYTELFRVSEGHFRICRVLVSEEYRGNGLSKAMLNVLISIAKDQFNCTKLSLAVFTHNAPAIACYQSLGFEAVKIETGTRRYNGQPWDLLRMEKSLLLESRSYGRGNAYQIQSDQSEYKSSLE